MKRYVCILLIVLAVFLATPVNSSADPMRWHGPPPLYSEGWQWLPFFGLAILGGILLDMNRQESSQTVIIERPPAVQQPEPYEPTVFGPAKPHEPVVPSEPINPAYWYYCEYSNGYYPYVQDCPGGWVKVVPIPPPPR